MTDSQGGSIFTASTIADVSQNSVFNCATCQNTDLTCTNCNDQNCKKCRCQGLYAPTSGSKKDKVFVVDQSGKTIPFGCSNCGGSLSLEYCKGNNYLNNNLLSQQTTIKSCDNSINTQGSGNVIYGVNQTVCCEENGCKTNTENTLGGVKLPFGMTRKEVVIGGAGTAGVLVLLLLI